MEESGSFVWALQAYCDHRTLKMEKGAFVQRLFSVFPNGWPGSGLLLQRGGTGAFLFYLGFEHFREASCFVPHGICAVAGILLLVGLWTPVCGAVIALIEAWIAFSCAEGAGTSILLAASGASMAMIGPGAWSIDARLFGRKHFEIPQR
jgi:putative oxidoreductase